MAPDAAPPSQPPFGRVLRFGRFALDPARKLLLADGQAVRLGGRALDLLIALVERAGEVVSHDDLFARAWPRTVVEESSLRVHMSALRKALGDGGGARFIASVPGRGYSFVMGVDEAAPAIRPPPPLPPRLTGIVGREQVLAALSAKLQRHRFVSIVGPGGIGKTTVAIALADLAGGRQAHGALFVDLAPIDDPSLVPATLAAALGVALPAADPWPTLEAALAARDVLILVDNCEHLIDAAATLAERVLRAGPRVRVLATSREPLEAESETLHRLEPLPVPPAETPLDVDGALAFPALRLFVERATASDDDFAVTAANLAAVVRVCRHLDGVPLAIELAAARVSSLGIHALADRLDDVFQLLRRGRRAVLPRHQTLQALLEWSHGLLDDGERTVLHRLSAFRASFTLDAAARLASDARIPADRVLRCVLDLVSRSLVELEPGDVQRYRLLYVTRLYAGERRPEDAERHDLARRHATCFRDLMALATTDLVEGRAALPDWVAAHRAGVPDIRAALEWAQGHEGDRLLGAELVVESGRLLLELGLNDEILARALDALVAVRADVPEPSQLELRLLVLLCAVSGQSSTERAIPPDTPARLDALSQRIGSPMQRRAALQALCINAFGHGDYPRVVDHAARLETLAPDAGDPENAGARLLGRRFGALGKHYLGEHRAALADAAYVLEHAAAATRGSRYTQMPAQVAMGTLEARILWLQGRADQALARALEILAFAERAHPLALSHALSLAVVPILLWRGDDDAATAWLERLADHDLAHGQSFWLAWSHGYCRILALRGHPVDGLLGRLGADTTPPNAMRSDMLGTLAAALAGPAQLARAEAGTVGWCAPEILRVHGERLLSEASQRGHAEATLLRALALARDQGARAWELRAATSLAVAWQSTGRGAAGRELLAGVVAAFAEGLHCADLRRAQALLAGGADLS